jgi:hypothetical protein
MRRRLAVDLVFDVDVTWPYAVAEKLAFVPHYVLT